MYRNIILKFSPNKLFLVFPLSIMLLFIIIIAYLNFDKFFYLRKRFKEFRNVVPEPFEM